MKSKKYMSFITVLLIFIFNLFCSITYTTFCTAVHAETDQKKIKILLDSPETRKKIIDLKYYHRVFTNGICSIDNCRTKETAEKLVKKYGFNKLPDFRDISLYKIDLTEAHAENNEKIKDFKRFQNLVNTKKSIIEQARKLYPEYLKKLKISVSRINSSPFFVKNKKKRAEIQRLSKLWHSEDLKKQALAVIPEGYELLRPDRTIQRWRVKTKLNNRGFNIAPFLWEAAKRNNAYEYDNFPLENPDRLRLKIIQSRPIHHVYDNETLMISACTRLDEIPALKTLEYRDKYSAILRFGVLLRRKIFKNGNDISISITSDLSDNNALMAISSSVLKSVNECYWEQEGLIKDFFKDMPMFENAPVYIDGTGLFMVNINRGSVHFTTTPYGALKAQLEFEIRENWPIEKWDKPGLPDAAQIIELKALGNKWKHEDVIKKRYRAVLLDTILKQLIPWIHTVAVRKKFKDLPEPVFRKANILDFKYSDIVKTEIKTKTDRQRLISLYDKSIENYTIARRGAETLPSYSEFKKAYFETFEGLIKFSN